MIFEASGHAGDRANFLGNGHSNAGSKGQHREAWIHELQGQEDT